VSDAPFVSLKDYTAMMTARVESQIRWDWELIPALYSLNFASEVNMSTSLAIKRVLKKGEHAEIQTVDIGKAAKKIYELLWSGKYKTASGSELPIRGDLSKMSSAVDLSAEERALFRNYTFMSGKLAGTRQIRRSMNHLTFSAQVVYGLGAFLTFTPSERHGLAVRFSRYRKEDPGITAGSPEFAPWIGHDRPSLFAAHSDDMETIEFDVPDYDLRRLMNARDPVSCVYAFRVTVIVVIASLFGIRMCPDCPHCNTSDKPCMDMFGSNANAMGGSLGRADGFIGAVEAQKAQGTHRFQNKGWKQLTKS